MKWSVKYYPEALKDLTSLDKRIQIKVLKAIDKVSENPLPASEGGYGKPLGNKSGMNLTGLLKIKLRGDGVRVIYELERKKSGMSIVVIGVRADETVYRIASDRTHNLHEDVKKYEYKK